MRALTGFLAAVLVAAAATPLAAAGNRHPAAKSASATERNRKIVTAFFDLLYNQKKVRQAFETYVAPNYVQHNPLAPDGRDAAISALEPFFNGAPGLSYEIKRIIVDGDLAAVHSLVKFSPQDRGSAVVDIVRLKNGRIAEHWDVIQAIPEKSANPHPMF